MLKITEKIMGVLGLIIVALVVYGIATDCPNVTGYHKDSGGRSCEVR